MIFLWIPFLILLAIYCYQEKLKKFWPATTLKVILSAFAAITAVYAAVQLQTVFGYALALGLICAVPADFFLQYIRSDLKKYRIGIFFFGAMHVCLLVGYYKTYGIHWAEFVIWVLMIVLLSIFQKFGKWDLGKVKYQLSAYTVLVTFMAAKSISIGITHISPATLILGIAGLCFYVSDLFLGIWGYYKDKYVYLALNRIIYFAGQLCFAFVLLLLL